MYPRLIWEFLFLHILVYVNAFPLENSTISTIDPEVFMNISEIIRHNGYPCENHLVTTEDGYILSLQRIPYGRKNRKILSNRRPPVFLQHGLLDSAHTWTNNLRNQSLAFILADAGFDVWLGNSRGNTYSDSHTTIPPNARKFWKFSWDEMAEFDLPACIDYVLAHSSNFTKLSYIGHSQGTMIMFARLSMDKTLSTKISSFVALGPVAYVGHVKAGLRVAAHFHKQLTLILRLFGHGRFMTNSPLLKELAKTLCNSDIGVPRLCSYAIFLLAGFDISNLNETRLPIYISHTPAGTSIMNINHYAQSVISNQFQKYDFGPIGNLIKYKQLKPPMYKLKDISLPMMFVSGGADVLADPDDVAHLVKELSPAVVKKHIVLAHYNHMDFVWGENAADILYPKVIKFVKQNL